MRKPFILVLTLLLGGLWTVGAQESSEDIALTVYNHGRALIRDRRALTLDEGIQTLRVGDIAAAIDPSSVSLQSLSHPGSILALEQHYIHDLANQETLLARYLDSDIDITAADGAVHSGELLGAHNGKAILRLNDSAVTVIDIDQAASIRFPPRPDAPAVGPTLQWLLHSSVAGDQDLELTYLTDGMNWSADYNIRLEADESSLDIKSWVTLENRSGRGFGNVRLKLVAGSVNQVQPQPKLAESRVMAFDAEAAGIGGGGLEPRELSEYQLYEISRPVSISNHETRQIEFISGANIPATSYFVFDSSPLFDGYYSPIDYPAGWDSSPGVVRTYLEFSTGGDGGLGIDLPGGRVRVYQADADGAALLIGEDAVGHTPAGEDVRVLLGTAFDLTGERTQTDFSAVSSDVIQERFEIRLRNRKDSDTVEIRIPERLYRWSDWEIIESSATYKRQSASAIEFRLELAPGSEETIAYTVQYRLPRNR